MQYNAVQHSAVQYSTTHSTVQYSTAQHSTAHAAAVQNAWLTYVHWSLEGKVLSDVYGPVNSASEESGEQARYEHSLGREEIGEKRSERKR